MSKTPPKAHPQTRPARDSAANEAPPSQDADGGASAAEGAQSSEEWLKAQHHPRPPRRSDDEVLAELRAKYHRGGQEKPAHASATEAASTGQANQNAKATQKRGERPPKGERRSRNEIGVLDRVTEAAREFVEAREPRQRQARREALERLLDGLTEEEELAFRKEWAKLSRTVPGGWDEAAAKGLLCRPEMKTVKKCQDDLREVFSWLDGAYGPAARLMEGIYQDSLAFEDSLPTPPPVLDPKAIEEWTVSLLRSQGLPEEKAREIAAEPKPSEEEWLRGELLAMGGCTQEQVEDAVAQWLRQGKWIAVCDVVEPGESATRTQERDQKLRTVAPQIAKLAAKAAQDLLGLLVPSGNAAAVRDQVLLPLFRTLEEARLVADGVPRAAWVADCIARGEPPPDDEITLAARGLAAVAKEARALGEKLARDRGQPPKLALDVAEALKRKIPNLTYSQIAKILDVKGFGSYTAENLRKSMLARRRLRGVPPAN